jgi:hypothetical protein
VGTYRVGLIVWDGHSCPSLSMLIFLTLFGWISFCL